MKERGEIGKERRYGDKGYVSIQRGDQGGRRGRGPSKEKGNERRVVSRGERN